MILTPKLFQRVVGILTGSLVAAMLAAVTIVGLQYAYSQRNTTTEAIEMRVFWWALAVPTFSTLTFFHTLRDLVKLVRGEVVVAEHMRCRRTKPQRAREVPYELVDHGSGFRRPAAAGHPDRLLAGPVLLRLPDFSQRHAPDHGGPALIRPRWTVFP